MIAQKSRPKMSSATRVVNGARLYYELRGAGTPLLFISGSTGDAGHFAEVADLLSDEHTVITYDRRANSRSPRPPEWSATSVEEQADDAAALVRELGFESAFVFGNSAGAIITLGLVVRHPEVVRGAIVHEPPLIGVLRDPDATMGAIKQVIERGLAAGGHAGAVEAFVRFAAGPAFDRIPAAVLARMLGNGETQLGVEIGAFENFRPSDEALRAIAAPIEVWVGPESAPFFGEAAQWLASRLGRTVQASPGAHTPMFDHPGELAEQIRRFVRGGGAVS